MRTALVHRLPDTQAYHRFVRITDRQAIHVGRLTLVTCGLAQVLIMLALLFSTELPQVFDPPLFPSVALVVGVLAWAAASLVTRTHMEQAAYLTEADRDEWKGRLATKVGFLVPFIYLLATPEDRQVGHRRKTKLT
jgi:hypothetical protein